MSARALLVAALLATAGCAGAPSHAPADVVADRATSLAPVCCNFGAPSAGELIPVLLLFAPIVIPVLVIGLPIWLIERAVNRS
jgi:hypothetical protein